MYFSIFLLFLSFVFSFLFCIEDFRSKIQYYNEDRPGACAIISVFSLIYSVCYLLSDPFDYFNIHNDLLKGLIGFISIFAALTIFMGIAHYFLFKLFKCVLCFKNNELSDGFFIINSFRFYEKYLFIYFCKHNTFFNKDEAVSFIQKRNQLISLTEKIENCTENKQTQVKKINKI